MLRLIAFIGLTVGGYGVGICDQEQHLVDGGVQAVKLRLMLFGAERSTGEVIAHVARERALKDIEDAVNPVKRGQGDDTACSMYYYDTMLLKDEGYYFRNYRKILTAQILKRGPVENLHKYGHISDEQCIEKIEGALDALGITNPKAYSWSDTDRNIEKHVEYLRKLYHEKNQKAGSEIPEILKTVSRLSDNIVAEGTKVTQQVKPSEADLSTFLRIMRA